MPELILPLRLLSVFLSPWLLWGWLGVEPGRSALDLVVLEQADHIMPNAARRTRRQKAKMMDQRAAMKLPDAPPFPEFSCSATKDGKAQASSCGAWQNVNIGEAVCGAAVQTLPVVESVAMVLTPLGRQDITVLQLEVTKKMVNKCLGLNYFQKMYDMIDDDVQFFVTWALDGHMEGPSMTEEDIAALPLFTLWCIQTASWFEELDELQFSSLGLAFFSGTWACKNGQSSLSCGYSQFSPRLSHSLWTSMLCVEEQMHFAYISSIHRTNPLIGR